MFYKKLIGTKCYLSPIDASKYELYTEWVNDLDVAVGMPFATMTITADQEKETLERLSKKKYHFAIVDLETEQLIGNIGFPKFNQIHQIGTVGIFIGNKEFWNKGYGQDALRLILDFGFNILNFYNINLTVYEFNKGAYNCYKKVGFTESGRYRGAKMIAGERYDEIIMDMTRDEYKSSYVKQVINQKMDSKIKHSC